MAGGAWWRDLFDELKRRRVIRVATLYVVSFWPLIQIVDILSPALSLPDTAMRYLVIAFVVGLPIALIIAWLFDLNQGGIVLDTGHGEAATGQALIGSRAELGIIAVMLMVAAGLLYLQLTSDEPAPPIAQLASGPAGPRAVAVPRSIAVLPFETLSIDPRDRFFADGLTEELLNVLSRVNGLQVAARTSSFAYRDSKKVISQIGKELDVDVILEGSVRRNDVDDTIRVTAQLIDTKSGKHYYSNTFDRKFSDVFKIQDEIAAAVVDELKVTLLGNEKEGMKSHASANAEALITYSMGQAELAKRTQIGMEDAIRFFLRAIEADEGYAEAWAGLADAHTLIASYGYGDVAAHLQEAQTAAEKALALDPGSGRVWASQGLIFAQQNLKEEAMVAFRKALSLNPSYSMAHMWYAGLLTDEDERFKEYELAYKLDPKSPVAGFNVARMLIDRGREAEAMAVFSKIIEADPFYPRAYDLVALVSLRRGRLGEAIRQFERAYELQPNRGTAYEIARLHNSLGNFVTADEWVARAKPGDTMQTYAKYDWLLVQRYAMQKDEKGVRRVLRKVKQIDGGDEPTHLIAATAAYLLGDYRATIEDYEKGIAVADERKGEVNFSDEFYDGARLAAAYAYGQLGDQVKRDKLAAEVRQHLDARVSHGSHDPEIWYLYAQVEALGGNQQLALINLQRAINEGWRQYWYPPLDPVMKPLMDQPGLTTMLAGLETQVGLMRDEFAFEESFASTPPVTGAGS